MFIIIDMNLTINCLQGFLFFKKGQQNPCEIFYIFLRITLKFKDFLSIISAPLYLLFLYLHIFFSLQFFKSWPSTFSDCISPEDTLGGLLGAQQHLLIHQELGQKQQGGRRAPNWPRPKLDRFIHLSH